MTKTITIVTAGIELAVDLEKINLNQINDMLFEFLQQKTVATNGLYVTNIDVTETIRPVTAAFLEGVE